MGREKKLTIVNVYQGVQPLGSFESEAEASAFILNQKASCRQRGIDCSSPEHSFSIKVRSVEEEEVTA